MLPRPSLIAALFLASLLVVQTVRIEGFKLWPISINGLKAELRDARAELRRISSKKNEQQVITRDRIVVVEGKEREADKVAEQVENAPLPGQCRTPETVLGADL